MDELIGFSFCLRSCIDECVFGVRDRPMDRCMTWAASMDYMRMRALFGEINVTAPTTRSSVNFVRNHRSIQGVSCVPPLKAVLPATSTKSKLIVLRLSKLCCADVLHTYVSSFTAQVRNDKSR
jgi:hypothetical protein